MSRGLRLPGLRAVLLPLVRAEYRRRRFPGVDEKTAEEFAVQLRALSGVEFPLMNRCARAELPPALVAYARDDHMIETEIAEELSRTIARARVEAFDEGGHNIQKTRAVELGGAIRALMAP
jgi:pimeloyl-ACP methyl ester carboxylesterase